MEGGERKAVSTLKGLLETLITIAIEGVGTSPLMEF